VDDVLHVAPSVPAEWNAFELRLRFRGRRVVIRAEGDELTIDAAENVRTSVAGSPARRFVQRDDEWEEVQE
jgi:trehalose/maltose hydrolase-like predicted phosphorylase